MAAEKEENETQKQNLLHLFDLYWFKHQILTAPISPNPPQKQTQNQKDSTASHSSLLHVITPSIDHQPLSSKHGDAVESPTSIFAFCEETEQFSDEEAVKKMMKKSKDNHRRKKAGPKKSSRFCKSFMELGFELSKEEAKEYRKRNSSSEIVRMKVTMNWKLPSNLGNENVMKKHLRIWAHAVASLVKYEKGNQSIHCCI